MLQMKCPECKKLIVSPLLSDLENVTCCHCQTKVPVCDVMVTANGFTFYRTDLNKRLHTYKNLLKSVIDEREMLEKDPTASSEGKSSLERMAQALRTLMATGRNNHRVYFDVKQPLEYTLDAQPETGILKDLSMSGACVEVPTGSAFPRKNNTLVLEFSLPGTKHTFSIGGIVCWTGKGVFGVAFKKIRTGDCARLWEYIATTAEGRVPEATVRSQLCANC